MKYIQNYKQKRSINSLPVCEPKQQQQKHIKSAQTKIYSKLQIQMKHQLTSCTWTIQATTIKTDQSQ